MEWTESINEIRKARDEDRLVIFVGSGVSANSEVPTWGRLIKEIAKEIEYDKCGECKKDCFDKEICKDRYNFTPDEYLRIPEYFYKKCEDDSKCKNSKECNKDKKHEKYYSFIKEVLLPKGSSFKPNAIDDIIFDILPDHIITTNYDSLLEDSESVNAGMYTVISDDKELINNAGKNYIIKMHGTFDKPESIILKESDYIEYDHTHPLISTFIKGILVNHSFLFVGYSLNDYNLRLIMGWINYYRKQYNSKSEKVKHFVVNTEKVSDYEVKRLSDNNIEVIDLTSMSDDAKNDSEAKEKLSKEKGRLLYTYLSCIEDDIKFEKYCEPKNFFANKCEALKSYKKINIGDLNSAYNLGYDHIEGTGLAFNNEKKFDIISKMIENGNEMMIDILQRSRITHLFVDQSFDDIYKIVPEKESEYSIILDKYRLAIDKAFRLYLDNDYIKLNDYIEKTDNIVEKIYYYAILGKSRDIIKNEIDKYKINKNDSYLDILLYKVRLYNSGGYTKREKEKQENELNKLFDRVPLKYKKVIKGLKECININASDVLRMRDILDAKDVEFKSISCLEVDIKGIKKMQADAYNYYFFCNDNWIPLESNTGLRKYIYCYINLILSSYALSAKPSRLDINRFEQYYILNEIDIDMLVKLISSDGLNEMVRKYHVQFIKIADDIDILTKYKNLCESYSIFVNLNVKESFPRIETKNYIDKIHNFTLLITLLDIDDRYKYEVVLSFFKMFKEVISKNRKYSQRLILELYFFLRSVKVAGTENLKSDMLDFLVEQNVYELFKKDYMSRSWFQEVIKLLSPYTSSLLVKRVILKIKLLEDEEKIAAIYCFKDILPMEEYKEYIEGNVDIIDTDMLLDFAKKDERYSDVLLKKIHDDIYKTECDIADRDAAVEAMGGRVFHSNITPSEISRQIRYAIYYKLIFPAADVSILKKYAHYSSYLQFILDPEHFDYSQIDTSDYMWDNLFKSKQYRKYFIKHKKEILSDNLKNIFETERDNRAQQKIVYGVLLDEDEIWVFPEEKWEIKN